MMSLCYYIQVSLILSYPTEMTEVGHYRDNDVYNQSSWIALRYFLDSNFCHTFELIVQVSWLGNQDSNSV